ncbi:MarR family winged helix-turn-helix transcriptional regulator [Streptomyces sp. NPDC059070]|uniref:MarR family winged helix-turn-helix transcriptional regulator n=1 Tax=Streptomyces sp. NPDC059070 TaxID=3346713 RepID=UPI0036A131EE
MNHLGGLGDDAAKGAGDGSDAIAREIADAVDHLTGLWSMAANGAAMRLSLHQLRALRILQGAPGLNLTGWAERLDIGLPTASRLCDRLEAAGLLERSLHPLRRREVRLSLTQHGGHVLQDVADRRVQALAGALETMARAERMALSRGMRAFLEAQGATLPHPDGPPRP